MTTPSGQPGEYRMRVGIAAALFASLLPCQAMAQDSGAPAQGSAGGASADMSADDSSDLANEDAATSEALAALPPLKYGAFIDLAEGYTTNAQGSRTSGTGKDDTFTRAHIGGQIHYAKPRLAADASYSLTGQYYGKFHRQNHLTNRLNLVSKATIVPDVLFVSANAFAAPALLTRVGTLTAGGEPVSTQNSRDSYGYVVRPELRLRFDDYATSSFSVSQGGIFFTKPGTDSSGTPLPIAPARDALSTTVSEQISSGSWFERLHWDLIGSYMQTSQSVRSQRQLQGLGEIAYALSRFVRVFAVGGYSDFKSSTKLSRNLSGPTALGGVTLTEGPDFQLTIEAGSQYNYASYMGSARWKITARSALVASVTDSVNTPQGDILSRLGQMSASGYGSFNDLGTGLGAGGDSYTPIGIGGIGSGLALDNTLYRVRNFQTSLMHTDDLTSYTLGLFATVRDNLDTTTTPVPKRRTSLYGARATVSHEIGDDMSVTGSASYSFGDEFSGHDTIFSLSGRLNYHLSETIDLYLADNFVHRNAKNLVGVPSAPLSEDQVILGIRARF